MRLIRRLSPDFKTIAGFRRDNREAIRNVCRQFIMLCHSLPEAERSELQGQAAEIRRLKAELKRVSEECDMLKKAAAYFAKESR